MFVQFLDCMHRCHREKRREHSQLFMPGGGGLAIIRGKVKTFSNN